MFSRYYVLDVVMLVVNSILNVLFRNFSIRIFHFTGIPSFHRSKMSLSQLFLIIIVGNWLRFAFLKKKKLWGNTVFVLYSVLLSLIL